MKITLDLTNPEDEAKYKRMVMADTAFGLLWDIAATIRQFNKYDTHNGQTTAQQRLDEIDETIHDSKLLDLYD